jgi:hypothetical protein
LEGDICGLFEGTVAFTEETEKSQNTSLRIAQSRIQNTSPEYYLYTNSFDTYNARLILHIMRNVAK